MRLPTRSPFIKPQDLLQLHQLLFQRNTPNESVFNLQRTKGLDLISLYLNRSNCPHAIESTAILIQSQILDFNLHSSTTDIPSSSSSSTSSSSQADFSARLCYSISIIRFVNSIVDSEQNGFFAQSINSIAERIGLPLAFVELRHASTHEELPSLKSFRNATIAALEWLDRHYWNPTLNSILNQTQPNPSQSQPQIDLHANEQLYSSSNSTLSFNRNLESFSSFDDTCDTFNTLETFKISRNSISNLRELLKTYKKISKLISKDYSLKGSLNREIGEICKKIEDWIKEIGKHQVSNSQSLKRRRRKDGNDDFNPNFIQIEYEGEGNHFNPNKFNRKRRRGFGFYSSDQDGESGEEEEDDNFRRAEKKRKDFEIKFGLEIFFKELLQIGGLVPLGMGKRTICKEERIKSKPQVEKGKEKEKEIEIETDGFIRLDEIDIDDQKEEEVEGIVEEEVVPENQDQENQINLEKEFTFNGIQILPNSIIDQWSFLFNHLSKTFKDFFTPLLIFQLIDSLNYGLPETEIESELQELDFDQQPTSRKNTIEANISGGGSSSNKAFPKNYTSTIYSWIIHLLESTRSESTYGMISNWNSKGWNKDEAKITSNDLNEKLELKKPRHRLAKVCLDSKDGGRSSILILKYLASFSSNTTNYTSQDLNLSNLLNPLIKHLENPSSSPSSSTDEREKSKIEKFDKVHQDHHHESSKKSSEKETGFEESLKIMRERLESIGKKKTASIESSSLNQDLKERYQELQGENQYSNSNVDGNANGVKRARFSDDLEIDLKSKVEEDGNEEEAKNIEIEVDESEDEEEEQEEEKDEVEDDVLRSDFSMTKLLGWEIPGRDEWEPTPIGMLRGRVPELELYW